MRRHWLSVWSALSIALAWLGGGPLRAQFAYVANDGGSSVSGYTIDPRTGALAAIIGSPFAAGADPVGIAFAHPKVHAVYITNTGSNTVSVINPSANTVVATVIVGSNPVYAAITPDGSRVYVTNAGAKSVSVISTATNQVIATVGVGANPADVSITPDGVSAYVTNADSKSVSVINTGSNKVTDTTRVGVNPRDAAIF
jgi:YVTN family beta-propeller protein